VEGLIMNALFGGTYSTHARRVGIWNRAAPIPGCDKAIWRCDDQGRVIRWADYGDRFSRYGWTVVRAPREGRLAQTLGMSRGKPVHLNAASPLDATPSRKAA
jgi:hypothetical protein